MRTANLSLRVDCFDDVDANRLDERAKREEEGDWGEDLAGRRVQKTGAKTYLPENGAVHGGWGGRGVRNEKQPLGKPGTAAKSRVPIPHVTERTFDILDRMGKRKRRQKTEGEGEGETEKPVLPQVQPFFSLRLATDSG